MDRPGEHPNVARVRDAAHRAGLAVAIRRFRAGTRTAEDAARAVGCDVAQIVKSLVFLVDDRPVVVLVSGADRVDPAKLAGACDAGSARRATGEEVRAHTGYPIGGVPPIGHPPGVAFVLDARLLHYDVVWAAAGLPDAVFRTSPDALAAAADARVADVRSETL